MENTSMTACWETIIAVIFCENLYFCRFDVIMMQL